MNLILDEEIENFEDVCNFLNWIPSINCGGCGVAALSEYRWLKQNRGEEPPIILFYETEKRCNSNLKNLKEEKIRKLKVPDHCVIGYPYEQLDEIISRWESDFKWNQMTNENGMLKLLNYGRGWNRNFPRRYISQIGERLKIDLSDVCLK